MNVTDKIIFREDGSLQMTMYANGDSVIQEMKGSYDYNDSTGILGVSWQGMRVAQEVIHLGKDTLKIVNAQGLKTRYLRN